MIFLFFIFSFILDNVTITGKVVDKNGDPIPLVMVTSGKYHTVANQQGEFKIKIDTDNNTLNFRSMGYKSRVLNVNLTSNLEVVLEDEIYNLNEVVVSALGAEEIIRLAIDQIGEIYQVYPATTTYEYGEKLNFQNAQSGEDNFIERFLLFNRQIDRYNGLPNFEILHINTQVENKEIAYLDSILYQKKYFRNMNSFFFEASNIPYFLTLNEIKRFNYQLKDENSEVYKIQFEGKSAKSEFDGEIWVDKDDYGISYLMFWKNAKALRSENLKLNLMTKIVNFKKITFTKEEYEIWNEKDKTGRYILKSSINRVESNYKKNDIDDVNLISNIKLNLSSYPKITTNKIGYTSEHDMFSLKVWKIPLIKPQEHTYLITFDH
jgi:hypothetical protein